MSTEATYNVAALNALLIAAIHIAEPRLEGVDNLDTANLIDTLIDMTGIDLPLRDYPT